MGRAVSPNRYDDRVPAQNSPPEIVALPEMTRRPADRALMRQVTVLYSPAGMVTPRMLNSSPGASRSNS